MEIASFESIFEKVYYINLAEHTERNAFMVEQLERYQIPNYQRIEAVKTISMPDAVTYRNFIKRDEKYILGSVSCRASHLKCLQTAVEQGYGSVLILEDDAQFLCNPHQLLQYNIPQLTDWDMLYFGGLVEPHFRNQIVCAHAYAVRHTVFEDILNMAVPSGMEIDNFYAKIIQQMSYNYNASGRYNIRMVQPFNLIAQNKRFQSGIQ